MSDPPAALRSLPPEPCLPVVREEKGGDNAGGRAITAALYLKLEGVLGREEAMTLMEHLPPVGWADIATKRDLEHLEVRMEAMEHRLIAAFRKELTSQTRTFALAMTGSFLTAAGIAVAAAVAL